MDLGRLFPMFFSPPQTGFLILFYSLFTMLPFLIKASDLNEKFCDTTFPISYIYCPLNTNGRILCRLLYVLLFVFHLNL